ELVSSSALLAGVPRALLSPGAPVFCVRQRISPPPIEEDDRPVVAVWHCNLGNVYPAEFSAYADRTLPRRLVPAGPVRFVTVLPLRHGRSTNCFGYVRLVPSVTPPARPPTMRRGRCPSLALLFL